MFIFLLIIILLIVSNWKIYQKANQPGWASIIPIYNYLVLFRIIGKPWWWLILMCIPYINIVMIVWATNLLSKKFGKDEGFTIGLIILPFIFLPILAFGDSRYQGKVKAKKSEGFDASDILVKQNKIDNSSLSENQKIIKNALEKYAYNGDEVVNNNTVNFKNEEIIIKNRFSVGSGKTLALNKIIPIKEITKIYFTDNPNSDWFTIETNPDKISDPDKTEKFSEFVLALSKDLRKNKIEHKKFMDSFEEIISPSSNKNISSKELFNQSNQLEAAESKNQNNDEKYEEEFLEELNSFDYEALEKKYEIELGDDAMDYWYKFVVDRARIDRESSEIVEKKETEEDKLLSNIYGHADEYGRKHIDQSFEFKRIHVLIRILSYGHIYSCLVNLESKILNKKAKPCSEEYKKDVRFRLIHAKASVYGTIKFALFSNIKKEEIKDWFPLFEDDDKLIQGKNQLEETIQKSLVEIENDPNNENLQKIKGIYDGAKRVPLYELSEKQRENVPAWFQGPFYKRGGKVTSKATGKEFKLNALEKSIFTELQYNTAIIEIFSENSDRSFFSNPFFSYMVTVVDEGTEWFKNNNPKAYNTLFEDSENSNKIKFCPNCGAKCENDKFCGSCGEKIL
tara:strand:- start:895 stop:2766 length:1872 start_codon:yes stop_codon:yes gene_type:complete